MIDNLVQIAHNVVLGRCCVLAGQVGISGSTRLGDFVMIGGQGGLAGHLNIGAGARIAAKAGLMRDVPAGGDGFRHSSRADRRFHEADGGLAASGEKEGRAMIDPACTAEQTVQSARGPGESVQIDIQRIMEMIPHRHPFLMIDRVVDVVANVRATGIKNLSINENFFQGIFPRGRSCPGC